MEFDFTKAEALLPWKAATLPHNLSVLPHWNTRRDGGADVEQLTSFWYERDVFLEDGGKGKQVVVVDTQTGEAKPEFGDTRCTKESSIHVAHPHEVVSPDGQWAAFVRNHNLWVRSLVSGEARALTVDGEIDYSYATRPDFYGSKTIDEIQGVTQPPMVLWAPDSSRILTHRLDQRQVRFLPVMQYVTEGTYTPAKMHDVHYPLPGDEVRPTVEHLLLGLDGSRIDFKTSPIEIRNTDPLIAPGWQNMWWDDNGQVIYYIHPTRDYRAMEFFEVQSATGDVRRVYKETSKSFIDSDARYKENLRPDVRVLRQSNTFIWPSDESGWRHLYLHDLETGLQLHPITHGDWVVCDIVAVDEDQEWVYFLASGREPGKNVYQQYLYRVHFDGSDLTLLTPEDAHHVIKMSPDVSVFVDTFSKVDVAPISVLRKSDGTKVRVLEKANIEPLLQAGYQLPEPFTVKAEDGETDIYGVLIRPANFDPSKRYPVVDCEYGGPQMTIVPHHFCVDQPINVTVYSQSLAQLGFAVVMIDGRGSPGRSKAFHNAKHQFGEAAGLVDHVACLRQLADKYTWLDMNRVGIHGFSGGGYGSARAILTYPDVYRVAVACCGNHDNRLYDVTWWERFMGPGDVDQYPSQDNQSLANNLRGRLLLMQGDIDDNVHPNMMMRLVDQLIEADKEFDMLLLPNRGHWLVNDIYVAHRTWAYFLRNL